MRRLERFQVQIAQSPDGRRRRGVGILGRVVSLTLIGIGMLAVAIAALARPLFGRWVDARNIDRLRRHYALDETTAEELYRLARREGFGSAWETVIDDRRTDERRRLDERRETSRTPERRQAGDRRLAGRHRA